MSSYIDEIPDGIKLNDTVFEAITQTGRIDGSTERYRNSYEFDTSNPQAYQQAWLDYPSAWDVYFGTTGKTFANTPFEGTAELEGKLLQNPQILLQAISFYIYTEGEDILFAEAQREVLELRVASSTDGIPLVDDGRIRAMEQYITDRGTGIGTYENPDAFYNPEVYDNVVSSDGFLPRVTMSGSQTLSSKYAGEAVLEVLSTDAQLQTEYENVLNLSDSTYGWGSPYATGGKKAREI